MSERHSLRQQLQKARRQGQEARSPHRLHDFRQARHERRDRPEMVRAQQGLVPGAGRCSSRISRTSTGKIKELSGKACQVAAKVDEMEKKAKQVQQQRGGGGLARRRRADWRIQDPEGRSLSGGAWPATADSSFRTRSGPLGRRARRRPSSGLICALPASSAHRLVAAPARPAGGRRRLPPSRPAMALASGIARSSSSAPSPCAAPARPITTSSTGDLDAQRRAHARPPAPVGPGEPDAAVAVPGPAVPRRTRRAAPVQSLRRRRRASPRSGSCSSTRS